jgi:hypothetical protein
LSLFDGATNGDTDDDNEEENEENEEENKEDEEENNKEDEEDTICVNKEAQEMPEERTLDKDDEDEGAHEAPNKDKGAQGAPNDNEEAQGAPNESDKEAQGASNEDENKAHQTSEPTKRHNLRGKAISYEHQHAHQFTQLACVIPQGPKTDTATDLQNHVLAVGFMFNQMGAKAGVKKHEDKATEAIVSECKQLDDKKAFKPRHQKELTKLQLEQVLRAITLVKEKRNGKTKGRTVANGRGQREHISRDDATSPTAFTEALMISIAIDAKERRHFATADVEGAHLQANMRETVIMLFEGDMVDCMARANPEKHGPCVHTTKKGKKLLCVELLKAPCGCIKSALLWHRLFTSTLQKVGFALNPCNQCVANKMIGGKQRATCWCVDDLKISHMKLQVMKDIISVIEKRHGKMAVLAWTSSVSRKKAKPRSS